MTLIAGCTLISLFRFPADSPELSAPAIVATSKNGTSKNGTSKNGAHGTTRPGGLSWTCTRGQLRRSSVLRNHRHSSESNIGALVRVSGLIFREISDFNPYCIMRSRQGETMHVAKKA